MDQDTRNLIADEVLFAREAAEYLSITTQRLNQLVHSGKIKPIKHSAAGTLFLKTDLDERKRDLIKIGGEINPPKEGEKMIINNKNRQEAVNYFTIHSLFNYSNKETEKNFGLFSEKFDVSIPIIEHCDDVAQLLRIEKDRIYREYEKTVESFRKLKNDDYIVKKGDELYPSLLAKTNEAPLFLFMRGKVQLLTEKIVSVVGTRNPSVEGKERAYRLSKLLGKFKIVVASGLAMGIDTQAHTAAIQNNNFTIAVIGTPINMFYPKENKNLQDEISQKGLLISQFSPSAPVNRWHFPMRNAVMSGISLATVIIEAGETSGALKQADYALKQGRFVFIPQSALDNENISWPKRYISRPGAKKFARIDELINELEKSEIINKDVNVPQMNLFDEKEGTLYVHRGQ
jgi:DNA processing protein